MLRLDCPHTAKEQQGRSWFTKGTVDRFVRFVSTPEVLELVKNIEEELAQLEQARSIQASSLLQMEEAFTCSASTSKNCTPILSPLNLSDGKPIVGLRTERDCTPNNVRGRYPYDAVDSGAEASKRELLRAMDVYLLALQQEQNIAFDRADAAGFDIDSMTDLVAFSEHFGADRLRAACLQCLAVSTKRRQAHADSIELDAHATSSGSDMSLSSVTGFDSIGETEVTSQDTQINKHNRDSEDGRRSVVGETKTFILDKGVPVDKLLSSDKASGQARRRRATSEDVRPRTCEIPKELNLGSSKCISNEPVQNNYPESSMLIEFKDVNQESMHDDLGFAQAQNSKLTTNQVSQPFHEAANDNLIRCFSSTIVSSNSTLSSAGGLLKDQQGSLPPNRASQSADRDVEINSIPQMFLPDSGTRLEPLQSRSSEMDFYMSNDHFEQDSRVMFLVEGDKIVGAPNEGMQSTFLGSCDSEQTESQINTSFSSPNWQDTAQYLSQLTGEDCLDLSPDQDTQTQANWSRAVPPRSSSPKRRSASPHRRFRIARSGARHYGSGINRNIKISSFQEPSNKGKNSTIETSISEGEGSTDDHHVEKYSPARLSSPAPNRRLSVQAAISLFENKHSIEAPTKQELGKQESCGGSSEEANSSSSGSLVVRRWTAVNDSGPNRSKECQVLDQELESAGFSADLKNIEPQEASLGGLVAPEIDRQQIRTIIESSDGISLSKFWPYSDHTAATNPSAELKVATGKQFSCHQPEAVVGDSTNAPTNLQLENSLSGESVKVDMPSIAQPAYSEWDAIELISLGETLPLKMDLQGSREKNASNVRSSVCTGRSGILFETQHLPMQDGSVATLRASPEDHFNEMWLASHHSEAETFLVDGQSTSIKVDRDTGKLSETFMGPSTETNHCAGRESLGSSCVPTLDFDMQALVEMVDHQNVDDALSGGQRGRFYEKYRKLRDARLMAEQDSKRAEREAKLRCMEETLAQRKAEMDARSAKLSRKNKQVQACAAKLQALEADLYITRKEQGDDGDKGQRISVLQSKDEGFLKRSPASPPVIPYVARDQAATPKRQLGKKASALSQKVATTPLSSSRAATSVPPRSMPRTTVGVPSNQRRSAVSSVRDNPLARSIPCFADLRKENTKPSAGRSSGSSRVQAKDAFPGRPRAVNEAALLEANGRVSMPSVSSNGAAKEGKKCQSSLTKKGCANENDLKLILAPGDDDVLVPVKGQRETTTEPVISKKSRENAIAPMREGRLFLRKGHGIAPGAGPGVLKLKASSTVDSAKCSDEEVTTTTVTTELAEGNDHTGEENLDAIDSVEDPVVHNVERELETGADFLSNVIAKPTSDRSSFSRLDLLERSEITAVDDSLPKDLFENERACHTISFAIDFETRTRYATSDAELDSNPQSCVKTSCHKQKDSAPLAQLLAGSALQSNSEIAASTLSQATSLTHEVTMPSISPAVSSPSSSSVMRPSTASEHFSPSSAGALESPLGSPASWNSSQIRYVSGLARTRKKWVASQKRVLPKEPAKGFKRLLNFARKSRASEVTTDCVSASTTSEGDDDSEESRDANNLSRDDLSRTRLQERITKELGHARETVDRYNKQGQGSIESLRSSIPGPPANFRLRDGRSSGPSSLKAPRSFFSLSSFWRGSEGKTR